MLPNPPDDTIDKLQKKNVLNLYGKVKKIKLKGRQQFFISKQEE